MRDASQPTGQRMAAEYLRQLLLKPGPYRDAWQRRVLRPRDDVINQLAVAEVISEHHPQGGGRPGESGVLPYQLREVVAGGLFGGHLTTETLNMFVLAFGFAEDEAGRLRRLLSGSSRISVMSGTNGIPIGTAREVDALIGNRRHHTLSLHDHIWLTSDGQIDRSRTLQVIEAITPGVDRVPIIYDNNVLTFEVGQGCKEIIGEVSRISHEALMAQVMLSRTLDLGETLTLEYWFSYLCGGDPSDSGQREYRRGVMRRLDNLDVRIEFHPDRLPTQIWWAHWDGADYSLIEKVPVTLDIQHSVHRYVRSIEKTVVGFYWEWD